jgi:hypothetical protein
MPPRISLASLIGIVAVIALGLAGMLSTSRLWLMLASTVTLVVLLAAILASWLFSGIDRAFWVGFALFGWTYLIMVNWDWIGGQLGHDLTAGISEAAEWLIPEIKPPPFPFGLPTLPPSAATTSPAPRGPVLPPPPPPLNFIDPMEQSRQRQIKIGNFVQIGRMLGALCFGALGGWLARILAQREEKRRAERPASPG